MINNSKIDCGWYLPSLNFFKSDLGVFQDDYMGQGIQEWTK